ncbi:fumarate hydratase [Chlamydiota bacterium]
MKTISVNSITHEVAKLCHKANTKLPHDVFAALEKGLLKETNPRAKKVLEKIVENARFASKQALPLCQDTGFVVCFVDIGQEVVLIDGPIEAAIQEGIRMGYRNLRKSIVIDPLNRINTSDNTPGIIHYRIVPGSNIKIILFPKGGGAENVSKFKVLVPTAGKKEIADFVLQTVVDAGGKPCPPIIVGIGIGGTAEKTFEIAKRSLFRMVGNRNEDSFWAQFEEELEQDINKTGIGPAGLGGCLTCLAVHIETMPCHIASLPVAVNIQCHAARHAECIL